MHRVCLRPSYSVLITQLKHGTLRYACASHHCMSMLPIIWKFTHNSALLYKQTQNKHMRLITHTGPSHCQAPKQTCAAQERYCANWAAVPASSTCHGCTFYSRFKPPLTHLLKRNSALYKALLLLCGPPAHSGSRSRNTPFGAPAAAACTGERASGLSCSRSALRPRPPPLRWRLRDAAQLAQRALPKARRP